MQDPGTLIATAFVLLYTILGPLVLFAIYVLFDSLQKTGSINKREKTALENDPSLWTNENVDSYLSRF